MRFVIVLLAALGVSGPASADEADAAWAALREGGHVALIRHADAPGGAGDPEGFQLGDCSTQRNLSEKGRSEAKALGERIRVQRVPIGKILTSQWCRCRETATLMALGDAEDAPTFNNAYVLSEKRDELARGGLTRIAAWRGPGTLIVVTHGANIAPLTGLRPAQGEIVVVDPRSAADGTLDIVGRIVPN